MRVCKCFLTVKFNNTNLSSTESIKNLEKELKLAKSSAEKIAKKKPNAEMKHQSSQTLGKLPETHTV